MENDAVYLKSLEIQGFKSFADRTLVRFDHDITAIVGPNGSGKSNISDAIRWVMGEMSSKELRGTKMEDVIFGGTQKRSPMGFAEATLTLDNSDHAFRMDTPEIQITRRYYRSGESEYYINRQSARLRDINELFMDTGLGREGYSNIGQGRIDEIVSLKSTDRREIFEEAAGISKYRHRKEETERRLASTEDNLLRIGDKISELELQVEPLREQAEKAKKFLVLRDELKGLEITVWYDSLEKLAAAARKAEEDYNAASFLLEQQHAELDSLYEASEQANARLSEMTQEADAEREKIAEAGAELERQSAEISVLRAAVKSNADNIGRVQAEMQDESQRSGGILQQIREQESRIDEVRKNLAEIRDKLQAAVAENEKQTAADLSAVSALSSLRAQSALLLTGLSAKKAELASLTASVGEVLQRRQQIGEDLAAAEERKKQTDLQAAEAQKALDDAADEVTSCKNTIHGYELRRTARADRRDGAQKKLDDLTVEQKTLSAKLAMFREMERDYEGFSKSVKIVMQEAERGRLPGVFGPVSSLIRTQDDYSVAIETALGAAMQNIVVATREVGKAGIRMLARCNGGRATFAPLDAVQGHSLSERGLENCRGFLGIASDLVSYDRKFDGILKNLLGRIVIADNLDNATEISRQYQSRFKVVTLDGQVLNAGGTMTGGSTSRTSGILTRANELERMETRMKALLVEKETAQKDLTEAARAFDEVEYQISGVQTMLRQAEDAVLKNRGRVDQFRVLQDAIAENIAGYRRELTAIGARSGSDETRLEAMKQAISAEEDRRAALEQEIRNAEQQHERNDRAISELNETITALRLEAASGETECDTALQSIVSLRQLSEQMQGDRSRKEELIASYEKENAELNGRISAGEDRLSADTQTLEEKKEALRQFLEKRNLVEQKRTRLDRDAQDKNRDILNMERETARLEQKKATTAMEEKQILDKLWDSYELTRTTAAEQRVQIESLAAANRRISELRRKISALGSPNIGAIEEFARVNERYEYLTGQRDDVEHSKKELEEIVRAITTEMREIFVREFARINEHFGRTFTEMFGGGKGSLELEDPSDPLSCGIEIRVQPPGKQLKTITLLSGGEKAFVAIALYFAILMVRPSSFCLLDEIDAALDDSNVGRFASYLRNLSDKTQFIVITHRRGTMEASDVLYGVTMQERGVSTILNIDLNQVQEQLGITEG